MKCTQKINLLSPVLTKLLLLKNLKLFNLLCGKHFSCRPKISGTKQGCSQTKWGVVKSMDTQTNIVWAVWYLSGWWSGGCLPIAVFHGTQYIEDIIIKLNIPFINLIRITFAEISHLSLQYSTLPITRTSKGSRKWFELSNVWVIGTFDNSNFCR